MIMRASRYKIMFSIDTDAHRTDELNFMRFGIGIARRGWLTKDMIINTMPLDKLLKFFKS